jgi:hypothetical protein
LEKNQSQTQPTNSGADIGSLDEILPRKGKSFTIAMWFRVEQGAAHVLSDDLRLLCGDSIDNNRNVEYNIQLSLLRTSAYSFGYASTLRGRISHSGTLSEPVAANSLVSPDGWTHVVFTL